jgi:uncharacterized protein DUF4389
LAYPVSYVADYASPRNRLTAFFRLILAIPILIWVALYGIVVELAVIAAWFVVVITAKFPEGLYRFIAGFVELEVQATAYTVLLAEPYPPFMPGAKPDYPVQMQFDGPLPAYSRLKAFFRWLLAIPIVVVRYVAQLLLEITAVAAWAVSVVLGRLPRGLFDPMVLANSYIARSDAYLFLLTETYPPFQDEQTRLAGVEHSDRRLEEQTAPVGLEHGETRMGEFQNPQ